MAGFGESLVVDPTAFPRARQELEKAQKERIRDAIEVGHSKSQQARFREVVHKGRWGWNLQAYSGIQWQRQQSSTSQSG